MTPAEILNQAWREFKNSGGKLSEAEFIVRPDFFQDYKDSLQTLIRIGHHSGCRPRVESLWFKNMRVWEGPTPTQEPIIVPARKRVDP